ncbi:MAG: hypothetical protein JWQ81_4353 [Amycolatopsis sp.]|jgi:hypothetical protein|uniref:hypothetical protein n=1 Tax=Amycolatopsis sp. TaxID=37632 RepID=UPI00262091B7|nr:hypothetical protein [Amycolatopsis sp.]MCU1683614.1 hypothetical protein [Amycolatopsis sp.]
MKLDKGLDRLRAGSVLPQVYGEPYETDEGVTVISVSRVSTMFGIRAAPVGLFSIVEGKVTWTAAEDETRIALVGVTIGLAAAVISTLAVLRRPPWPDLSVPGLAMLKRRRES